MNTFYVANPVPLKVVIVLYYPNDDAPKSFRYAARPLRYGSSLTFAIQSVSVSVGHCNRYRVRGPRRPYQQCAENPTNLTS